MNQDRSLKRTNRTEIDKQHKDFKIVYLMILNEMRSMEVIQ